MHKSNNKSRWKLIIYVLLGLITIFGGGLCAFILTREKLPSKINQLKNQVLYQLENTGRDIKFTFYDMTKITTQNIDPTKTLTQKPASAVTHTPTAIFTQITKSTITPTPSNSIINGPLRVNPANGRYFTDNSGKAIYLTGSHTWSNLQDNGQNFPPPIFDYTAYLQFLVDHHHNFFRLWTWEQSRWTLETLDENYWFNPMGPFLRTGPGTALDGQPKFDLEAFNSAYFTRMRQRILAAGQRGIYVSIMLFDGWSVANYKGYEKNNPWKGHPLNAANNINGINGDPYQQSNGLNTQDLSLPQITAYQEAYVKKVIDTVGDLDNVLYEIDNEGDSSSLAWQIHLVRWIHTYEATRPKQHPVGMTALYPGGSNAELMASPADWISPNDEPSYLLNPPPADGSKVILSDTDHLCGICYDHRWIWKSFTRGLNPIYMDGYDGRAYGVGAFDFDINNPDLPLIRNNLGYALAYAQRMDLAAMAPRPDLCSSGFCLANPDSKKAEYLVYSPDGGKLSLEITDTKGGFQFEWLNPINGEVTIGGTFNSGGFRSFIPPFSGEAVLYIHFANDLPD